MLHCTPVRRRFPTSWTCAARPRARSAVKSHRNSQNVTADPASEIGSIRTAYALKSSPAYEATMMLTGLETTNGATPAAMKTAKTNGVTRRGCAG